MSIEPMAPGGHWLAEGGTGTPHYVVNPDHVKRLLGEGYQIVADPRLPVVEASPEEPAPVEEPDEEEDTKSKKGHNKR